MDETNRTIVRSHRARFDHRLGQLLCRNVDWIFAGSKVVGSDLATKRLCNRGSRYCGLGLCRPANIAMVRIINDCTVVQSFFIRFANSDTCRVQFPLVVACNDRARRNTADDCRLFHGRWSGPDVERSQFVTCHIRLRT